MAQPEKLSWWDRWFNRYRKEVVEEGVETWTRYNRYMPWNKDLQQSFQRRFVKYKTIDRVTGSETISIEYLGDEHE